MSEAMKIPMNARELHIFEYITCLDKQLSDGQAILEERLRKVPNCWRNYRLAASSIEKVVDAVYSTLPDKTLLHMEGLARHGEVVIRKRPMVPLNDDAQFVLGEDLKVLINTSIAAECALCLRDKQEQKKCKLRRALMNVAPTEALANDGLCPYTHVVAGNELGDYI